MIVRECAIIGKWACHHWCAHFVMDAHLAVTARASLINKYMKKIREISVYSLSAIRLRHAGEDNQQDGRQR